MRILAALKSRRNAKKKGREGTFSSWAKVGRGSATCGPSTTVMLVWEEERRKREGFDGPRKNKRGDGRRRGDTKEEEGSPCMGKRKGKNKKGRWPRVVGT